jgi:hypothetical protein
MDRESEEEASHRCMICMGKFSVLCHMKSFDDIRNGGVYVQYVHDPRFIYTPPNANTHTNAMRTISNSFTFLPFCYRTPLMHLAFRLSPNLPIP